MNVCNTQSRAFSLIELSIVLVILGLLVGGILAGQSLIRASQLKTVTTDYSRFVASTYTFRDKYFYFPGDMKNATAFWGVLNGTGDDTTCQTTAATGLATCNGDGDGTLRYAGSSVYEYFRFWQHLVNAELVEGKYTGQSGSRVPGVNVPPVKVSGSGYYFANSTDVTAATTTLYAMPATRVTLQLIGSGAGGGILMPEEAWNIDTKLDDGVPGTGRIMSNKGDGASTFCTNNAGSASDTNSAYSLSNTNKDCYLSYSVIR